MALALFLSPIFKCQFSKQRKTFLFHVARKGGSQLAAAQISRVQTPADAILSIFRFCFGAAAVWGVGLVRKERLQRHSLDRISRVATTKNIIRLHQTSRFLAFPAENL